MTKKDSYHHGDLRQKIIDEALSWIERENIVSLSLRGIARRLGVSHNAPYRHFPDKESLLVAIAEIGFRQLNRALQQALDCQANNYPEKLENIGVAYIRYALANQTYYRVMFSDRQLICDKYPELDRISEQAFMVLLNAIEAGQEAKVFIAEDSRQLARVCWSLTHGVSMLAIDNQFTISSSDDLLQLAQIATKTVSRGLTE
jgi:AcrR family transcriptional regulator